ncbi:unnamed protein product, partial [Meganyctiphanes norvegica]
MSNFMPFWTTGLIIIVKLQLNDSAPSFSLQNQPDYHPWNYTRQPDSSDQFVSEILQNGSSSSFMWWLALAVVIVWILSYLIVGNGIRIMGKVSNINSFIKINITVILLIV